MLHQDISRKCPGSFLSAICDACAVVGDVYILRSFCSHRLKSCAVVILNLAVLTLFKWIVWSYQDISRKCLGSFLLVVGGACACVGDVYILRRFCSHRLKSCAVMTVNLAILTLFQWNSFVLPGHFQEVSWYFSVSGLRCLCGCH